MSGRLDVKKTHKLYVGGQFPRSESGRTFPALDADGAVMARMSLASRKDLRDAVRVARGAQSGWAGRTGYNRGQILYRIAEMVEERSSIFAGQLREAGSSKRQADAEVAATVDRLVWYAGWCDKYAQVMGNLNPVAGPFFNISVPEPSGVVGVIAPAEPALLGLVSRVAPPLVTGNTVIVVASETRPVPAIAFAEALATSDVPGGVVNILTGSPRELAPWLADHMDVNVLDVAGAPTDMLADLETASAENMKRIVKGATTDVQSPYLIAEFTETKTVWHPKGV
ncbi:MAG: aldehyde dehydrogenase family protein [Acidimicrobiia bacterium]|nr:aldehyde dehydrogenase family protein [Acidimicrobiia bacterium]MDH4307139.1 aldehyde dehydrogenase family protein [Acidimicrobiia bacterium]MDH5294801.1 aldehyde dehydrogenase family protein [Acidimicrobiia bacterium]